MWLVDCKDQSVYVYGPDGLETYLRLKGTLTAPTLFPDLSIPVEELFRIPIGS